MNIIRTNLEVIKTILDEMQDRLLQKPIAQSMKGKRFLYYIEEHKKDIASIERLLNQLEEIERKYPENKDLS